MESKLASLWSGHLFHSAGFFLSSGIEYWNLEKSSQNNFIKNFIIDAINYYTKR